MYFLNFDNFRPDFSACGTKFISKVKFGLVTLCSGLNISVGIGMVFFPEIALKSYGKMRKSDNFVLYLLFTAG